MAEQEHGHEAPWPRLGQAGSAPRRGRAGRRVRGHQRRCFPGPAGRAPCPEFPSPHGEGVDQGLGRLYRVQRYRSSQSHYRQHADWLARPPYLGRQEGSGRQPQGPQRGRGGSVKSAGTGRSRCSATKRPAFCRRAVQGSSRSPTVSGGLSRITWTSRTPPASLSNRTSPFGGISRPMTGFAFARRSARHVPRPASRAIPTSCATLSPRTSPSSASACTSCNGSSGIAATTRR